MTRTPSQLLRYIKAVSAQRVIDFLKDQQGLAAQPRVSLESVMVPEGGAHRQIRRQSRKIP